MRSTKIKKKPRNVKTEKNSPAASRFYTCVTLRLENEIMGGGGTGKGQKKRKGLTPSHEYPGFWWGGGGKDQKAPKGENEAKVGRVKISLVVTGTNNRNVNPGRRVLDGESENEESVAHLISLIMVSSRFDRAIVRTPEAGNMSSATGDGEAEKLGTFLVDFEL